jgi:hypothetical protein
MEVIYQLDVSTSQRRFEFEGEKQIRDFLRRGREKDLRHLRVITKSLLAEAAILDRVSDQSEPEERNSD